MMVQPVYFVACVTWLCLVHLVESSIQAGTAIEDAEDFIQGEPTGIMHSDSYMMELMDTMKHFDFNCRPKGGCRKGDNCFEDGEDSWEPAYVDSVKGYLRHRKRNAALPLITKVDLTLPQNTKMLWYGHSYTREIADNVIAANLVRCVPLARLLPVRSARLSTKVT
jgi:hypothetical protein